MKKIRFFNSDFERKPEKLKPANSKRGGNTRGAFGRIERY